MNPSRSTRPFIRMLTCSFSTWARAKFSNACAPSAIVRRLILWWGAAHTTFQTAAEENLLAAYRPTWADKVPAGSRDAQDRWYGTYQTPEVIVYNSDAVKPEDAPKDWDDVLDPKWRDKILIRNPNPSDSMRAIFGAMIWRFYKDTGSPEQGL